MNWPFRQLRLFTVFALDAVPVILVTPVIVPVFPKREIECAPISTEPSEATLKRFVLFEDDTTKGGAVAPVVSCNVKTGCAGLVCDIVPCVASSTLTDAPVPKSPPVVFTAIVSPVDTVKLSDISLHV